MNYDEKVSIILKWLDKEINIASYTEDRVKRAIKFGLFEIRDKQEEEELESQED